MARIDRFSGDHRFLSNFYPCSIFYNGRPWPSVEHAYQAAKTQDSTEKRKILECKSAAEAKKVGRGLSIRKDWESVKVRVMMDLLRIKFLDKELRKKLLATGEAQLEEGNNWGDQFWGICRGIGENMLGKLLMQVRLEIWQHKI